jgi:hypothetical protein
MHYTFNPINQTNGKTMSDTIWVRRKSKAGTDDSGDDFDHSLFCKHSDALDELADSLAVDKLSDYFDTTDLQFNMSEEDLPESWIVENEQWFEPNSALIALNKIIEKLKISEVKWIKGDAKAELLEELDDCEAKVATAVHEKDQFHFCIVM